MDLSRKILADYFAQFGYLDNLIDPTEIIHDRCYQAICEIKGILEDDSLDDTDCFWRIEKIVTVLEELGLDAGTRHDF